MRLGCLAPIAVACVPVVSRLALASGSEIARHENIKIFARFKQRPVLEWVWFADETGLIGCGFVGCPTLALVG